MSNIPVHLILDAVLLKWQVLHDFYSNLHDEYLPFGQEQLQDGNTANITLTGVLPRKLINVDLNAATTKKEENFFGKGQVLKHFETTEAIVLNMSNDLEDEDESLSKVIFLRMHVTLHKPTKTTVSSHGMSDKKSNRMQVLTILFKLCKVLTAVS